MVKITEIVAIIALGCILFLIGVLGSFKSQWFSFSLEGVSKIALIIMGVIIISFGIWNGIQDKTIKDVQQKSNPMAWLIKFKVHYLPINSDPIKIAWDEISSKMGPICIQTDKGLKEVQKILNPDDASGQFVLTTKKNVSSGKLQIGGIGFYDESIRVESGARMQLFWALDFHSSGSVTKDQLKSGIEVKLNFFQKGLGVSLPFDAILNFKDYKLASDSAFINYKGTHIATIVMISSEIL